MKVGGGRAGANAEKRTAPVSVRTSYTYRCPDGHGHASFAPEAPTDPVPCRYTDSLSHVCNAPMERIEVKS